MLHLKEALGESAGAVALFVFGVIMVLCGAGVCWCLFSRARGRSCQTSPRRW